VAKASKPKKKTALAAAASRRLSRIGTTGPTSPDELAHIMMHAEERGQAERVPLADGSWGWQVQGPNGEPQLLKPTPEMLEALERFEREGHPAHGPEHDQK
jgi:hypothetical protein